MIINNETLISDKILLKSNYSPSVRASSTRFYSEGEK